MTLPNFDITKLIKIVHGIEVRSSSFIPNDTVIMTSKKNGTLTVLTMLDKEKQINFLFRPRRIALKLHAYRTHRTSRNPV